ncbi:MAG: hypothetical protein IJ941_05700 [Clostridia bacterium]|nr:hypothetical protein [Clostridia bacterium]
MLEATTFTSPYFLASAMAELTYNYTDFYENLMKDEIPSIMEMVADQKAKYGVE